MENNQAKIEKSTDKINFFKNIFFNEFIKISIFVYTAGFIIVNAYFIQFGFIVYDLTSSRFLIAGILFLLVSSFIILMLNICKRASHNDLKYLTHGLGLIWLLLALDMLFGPKKITEGNPYKFFTGQLLTYFIFIISLSFWTFIFLVFEHPKLKRIKLFLRVSFVVWFLGYFSIKFFQKDSYFYISFSIFILLSIFCYYFSYWILKKDFLETFYAFNISSLLVTIFSLVCAFGVLIYPKIDRMKGGGAPLKAALVMSENQKSNLLKSLKDYDVNFDNVEIVHETFDSLFIIFNKTGDKKDKLALEIQKKSLIGIKYLKSESQGFSNSS